jgi:hypothetical protein
MEHSELVARVLKEVATARAAIAAGYFHLWRPDEPTPTDPDRTSADAKRRETEVNATREWKPSQDES